MHVLIRFRRHLACGMLLFGVTVASGQEPAPDETPPVTSPVTSPAEGLSPVLAKQLGQLLERDWQDRPEWAEMMVSLLKGQGMRLGEGWFQQSESLYDWLWLSSEFDGDLNGRVELQELPVIAERAGFLSRLDGDRDGTVTLRDLRGRPGGPAAMMAGQLFSRWDLDSNGKISKDEINAFFEHADAEEQGFLTPDDLRRAFSPPPVAAADGEPGPQPTPAYWLRMLLTGQLGSMTKGPSLGDPAPDFDLPTFDGKERLKLSNFRGKKPVVLIFGSFT